MIRYWTRVILPLIFLLPCRGNSQGDAYRLEAIAVPLPQLIDMLEKEFDVHFSYPSELLADERFYLKTNTSDLSNILDEIVAIHEVEYQVLEDQSILIRDRLSSSEQSTSAEVLINIEILDEVTGVLLENAAVNVKGTNIGDYTSADGQLSLSVQDKAAPIVLETHLLGYQSAEVTYDGSEKQVIRLAPQEFSITEVMINDRQDVAKVNTIDHFVELSTAHMSSFSSGIAGKDVLRQAQMLPGVAAFDDKSSGLKIRGADEASSLIMLDDIPIYSASHYYGLFSSINPSYASSSLLYKNNLPVSHDGKTAGMLDVRGPTSSGTSTPSGAIDINLLSLSGAVTIPILKGLSWTVAGRTTYQNVSDTDLFSLFNSPDEEEVTVQMFTLSTREKLLSSVPDFSFYDINSKLRYNWKNSFIEFNYYRSQDDLDDTFENQFRSRRQNAVVLNNESYVNTELWENNGYNLKMETKISSGILLAATAYKSTHDNLSTLNIDISRSYLREMKSFSYSNLRDNNVEDTGLKVIMSAPESKIDWQAGVEVVDHKVDMRVVEDDREVVRNNKNGLESSLFAAISPIQSPKVKVEIGMRASLYENKVYPSPRINMSYLASERWTLKGSVGRHNQFVRQISFENTVGRSLDFWVLADDRRIDVSSADQIMLGTNYKYGRFTLDLEAYYRKRYNLLEQALYGPRFNDRNILPLSNSNGNEYRLFRGDGETIGMDVMAGVTYPKYSGWLAYTLSKSTIRYDQILGGTPFPSQDDRRHQIKLVNEYRLGRFTLGANFVYSSGRPYTDLNKVADALRRDELRPQDRISRLPDYIRADLSVAYGFDIGASTAEIGLSVYNLLNRQNVNYVQYLFSVPTNSRENPNAVINTLLGTESNLLNRTVNLNLSIKF